MAEDPGFVGGWFDNHCHLTTITRDPAEVVAEAGAGGVDRLLTVGCDVADSARAIDIANGFDNVWATAGVHPHDAKGGIDGLVDLLEGGDVVAVGECGLDYHYDNSPREEQRAVFAEQIALAHRFDLALVIHSRDAWGDTFAILDDCGVPERTVFHCFTGGPDEAEEALARGTMLSFSGIVTFPSATDLQEAARRCPIDRTLVETDSPFLAPVPHRGKKNQPAYVAVVGHALADLQGCDPAELAAATTANGRALYQI
ncbi:MAG: TatD family hydrolase [Acidimicrobiales bacterium]